MTLSWAWVQEDVCRVGSVVRDHRHAEELPQRSAGEIRQSKEAATVGGLRAPL